MTDKKLIEKYLKLYPRIDKEINEMESDLKFYESRKTEYESNNQHKNRDDLIGRIDAGLKQKHDEIFELMFIKEYISNALRRVDADCRQIIELRLWKNKHWNDITPVIGVSQRQSERIYQQIFRCFENFNPKILPDDVK